MHSYSIRAAACRRGEVQCIAEHGPGQHVQVHTLLARDPDEKSLKTRQHTSRSLEAEHNKIKRNETKDSPRARCQQPPALANTNPRWRGADVDGVRRCRTRWRRSARAHRQSCRRPDSRRGSVRYARRGRHVRCPTRRAPRGARRVQGVRVLAYGGWLLPRAATPSGLASVQGGLPVRV